ncbi:MAG: 4Fe-4S binding protein [Candidatus Lokiarchaeota archaeon]|nr:4Fe-4S binding protein [Candidatus Lokiarchaeota archaeon]
MVEKKRWKHSGKWVEIDLDACSGLGLCVETCPADVYDLLNEKVFADNIGECIECLACQDICPNDAITRHFAWSE